MSPSVGVGQGGQASPVVSSTRRTSRPSRLSSRRASSVWKAAIGSPVSWLTSHFGLTRCPSTAMYHAPQVVASGRSVLKPARAAANAASAVTVTTAPRKRTGSAVVQRPLGGGLAGHPRPVAATGEPATPPASAAGRPGPAPQRGGRRPPGVARRAADVAARCHQPGVAAPGLPGAGGQPASPPGRRPPLAPQPSCPAPPSGVGPSQRQNVTATLVSQAAGARGVGAG